jgi:hypothetical protein
MARIRTIKPEFFRHYDLFQLEKETELPIRIAFIGLWTVADREGRFKWRPEALKVECLPYDILDFSRVLDALMTRGFICSYASNGEQFGYIPSFLKHQVINNRERPSFLPNPLECDTSTRGPRDSDAWSKSLCKVKEEKEKEKEKEKEGDKYTAASPLCELGKSCNGKMTECTESFSKFWVAYPRHDPTRKEALKSWCRQFRAGLAIESILKWISEAKTIWDNPKFIPQPTTWLNQRRWEGDLPAKDKKNGIIQKTLIGDPGSTSEQRNSRGEKLYIPKQV